MHLLTLASGSAGNATLVRAGETHLLVDAGLDADGLADRLREARVAPGRIHHLALTHGHLDHARGAGEFSRRHGAAVHCAEALMSNRSLRGASRLSAFTVGRPYAIPPAQGGEEGLELVAVPLPHDARPTVAFRIAHAGRVAAVVTDMGRPTLPAAEALTGAHLVLLEFNHDVDLLVRGPYPQRLKRRVGGDHGHLSNDQAAAFLERLIGPQLHTLVLAHLSRTNNTPELALAAARRALGTLGREDVRLVVADQDRVGPNLKV